LTGYGYLKALIIFKLGETFFMAKVTGLFKIKGTIGDTSFFENEFGPQVKMKGGPSEWHIENQDSYKNALRNAAEFKRATAAAQLLRAAMGSLRNGVKSMRLNGRMIAPMLQAIKADPVNNWGERMIGSGDLSVMAGFEFNHRLSLDDALPLNVENCYTVEAGKVSLQIPAFRLRKKKALPLQATHYRLVSCMLSVDFEKRRYQREIQESPLLAMGRQAGAPFCAEHVVGASTPGCFWLLGIEFYTMENDKPKLVKGGALRVMQWMGTACKDAVGEVTTAVVEEAALPQATPVVITLPAATATSLPATQFNYVLQRDKGGGSSYQSGYNTYYGASSTTGRPRYYS
jgi:hypothetical protein